MSIPRSILLADDDSSVREGVADLLLGLGLEVFQAETGLEALEIARSRLVRAALLDLHMPGCTGLEALPLLRRERRGLACIVYSGDWNPDLEARVVSAGACAVLHKPVPPDLLRQEVLRALDRFPYLPGDLGSASRN